MYEILIGVFIFLSIMVVFVSVVCYFQSKSIIQYGLLVDEQKEYIDRLDHERHSVIIEYVVLKKKVNKFCSKCENKEVCVDCDLMIYEVSRPIFDRELYVDSNMIQPDEPWERE